MRIKVFSLSFSTIFNKFNQKIKNKKIHALLLSSHCVRNHYLKKYMLYINLQNAFSFYMDKHLLKDTK